MAASSASLDLEDGRREWTDKKSTENDQQWPKCAFDTKMKKSE